MKQFEFRLNRITAIKEHDRGGINGSDPYLWVCYFYVDGDDVLSDEPVRTYVPIHDTFRSDIPNNIYNGQSFDVPLFIGRYTARLNTSGLFYMAGCVVVMLDENQTSLAAMKAGRDTFATAIHRELNTLIRTRITSLNTSDITDEEVEAIQLNLEREIFAAVEDKVSVFDWFDDHDVLIGATYCAFMPSGFVNASAIPFPDILDGDTVAQSLNQFALEGSFRQWTVINKPNLPISINCNLDRKAVADQQRLVNGLANQVRMLQEQLRNAPPGQKAAILRMIREVREEYGPADELLGEMMDDLHACEDRVRNLQTVRAAVV